MALYRVAKNTVVDSTTSNIVELLYYGHVVYSLDNANVWRQWTGTAWTVIAHDPRATESAQGAQVTGTTGSITDQAFNTWTLVQSTGSGLQVARNGVVNTSTTNVTLLLYWNHTVYQQNSAGSWWYWSGSAWVTTTDPRNQTTGVPGVPTGFAAGTPSTSTVPLTWGPPTSGGVIDAGGYILQYKPHSGSTWTKTTIPVITPGKGSFVDQQQQTWTITSGGQLSINNVVDGVTQGVVIALMLLTGQIWQQNNQGNWYFKNAASDTTWQGPSTVSPLANPGNVIIGLTKNTSYDFQVYAFNTAGSGSTSSIVTVTTANVSSTGFSILNGKILDPNGNVFVSRGIAVMDHQINAISGAQVKSFFPRCNLIRLSIGNALHGFQTPAFNWTTVTNWINAAVGAGLVVVVDDHEQYGQTSVYSGGALSADLAYATQVGNTFKNQPYVWIQSMNEPGGTGPSLAGYHLQFYNAFRNTGASNIVLHDGYGGNLPNPPSDATSPYLTQWNAGWDAHFYNWMTSGNTNQSQVNNYLNTHVQSWMNFVNFASGAGKSGDNVPCVWMGEVGFLDYNGNPYQDANGGDGTNQIVIAPFQTNTGNGGLCSGQATWLLSGQQAYQWGTMSDLLNPQLNGITQHGTVWNNNA